MMNKLLAEEKISISVLAFVPQYVLSNGAVSFEPSNIFTNVSSQLGIVRSLNVNDTTYDSAIVINQEQYCDLGSTNLIEPHGPLSVEQHSKIK